VIQNVAVSLLVLLLTAFAAWRFARWMRGRRIGQQIRDEGPAHHRGKAGTPTMGGVVVLSIWAAAVAVLSLGSPFSAREGFVVASGLSMGAIGALDDLLKLVRRQSLGLTGWQKIGLTAAGAVGLFFAFPGAIGSALHVPFSGITVEVPPWALCALTVVVFLAATNAVNLTDGLDGLAAGVVLLILLGLLALSPSISDLRLLLPLVGGLAGFLWVNGYPATLIMGDVGSFGLGGIVAAVALAQGTTFLLPILAGVPVLEVVAVILQVASLRLFGRRIFRMSPLHHHFEASPGAAPRVHLLPAYEWPEMKVVVRFWIAQGFFVGLAVLASRIGH
jgi:phospho-N-acetylmuramoyl-pentapeptide-transferase